MTKSHSKPDPCAQVPLDVYAHVRAALAEDFRLREILELEGVAPAHWTAADLAWKRKLASDAKDLARFEHELILAEDWLGRDVAPLQEDVAAWTAFLDAYLSSPARFDFVTGLGLRMSDVTRLQRRWALRMQADRAIEKQAVELRRKPLVMPAIRVVQSTLRRSRNGKPIAASAVTIAPTPTVSVPGLREVRGVDLNQFASITAEIRVNPGKIEATLRRHGLAGENDYREIERAFQDKFSVDTDAERDYHRLLAHHDGRLRVAGTSLSLDVPRGPALPFVAPSARTEAATLNLPLVDGAVERPPAPTVAASPLLAGTALAVDVPQGPATPFRSESSAPAATPPRGPMPGAVVASGTALALDGPRAPATPFRAPEPEALGFSLARYVELVAARGERGANPANVLSRFGIDAEAHEQIEAYWQRQFSANGLVALAFGRMLVEAQKALAERGRSGAVAPVGTGTVLTLDVPRVPLPLTYIPILLPELTVDQYAWLAATLRRTAPADLPAVLARVRLTPETRKELETRWSSRMAADPHLKETFLSFLARHLGAPGG